MLRDWDVAGRLRQPEYTGENRCTACTLVNASLVAIAGAVVGAAGSPPAGIGVLVAGAVVVYLRGYVVPGTPTLTGYLPNRFLAKFDHHEFDARAAPEERLDETAERSNEAATDDSTRGTAREPNPDPETVLFAAGAIRDCESVDDLCLRDDFRATWYDRMERLDERLADVGATEALLADRLGVDGADLTIDESDREVAVRVGGAVVAYWESRAAMVADFAAMRALEPNYEGWGDLDVAKQSEAARSLRTFLDVCPGCGEYPTVEQVSSCCASDRARTVIHCSNCETILFRSAPRVTLPEGA